jgi:REP element-mobilizing transposase RayT
VRNLVAGKQQWSSKKDKDAASRRFRGWHERGYLPHRDEPELTQFVTFRLADTFPNALRSEWEHLWRIEDDKQRRIELEAYLDRGSGECCLRQSEIAGLVESNILNHSGFSASAKRPGRDSACDDPIEYRYELRSWCIMPNHVHVLFKVGGASMADIVGAWKKHTGRLANRVLKKHGSFWAEDYFDTYMRDAQHERRTVRYIEHNPTKAKLVLDPADWPWSSARFRDSVGMLKLPG